MLLDEFIRGRILELRLKNNLSERKLSEKLGYSPGYIGQISNGGNLPSLSALKEICNFFHVTLSEFFEGESEEENSLKNLLAKLVLGSKHSEFLKKLLQDLQPEDVDRLLESLQSVIEKYPKE